MTDYLEHHQIFLDELIEKKNDHEKKRNHIYYSVYMLTDKTIRIYKNESTFKYIDNCKDILYCIEYIDSSKMTIGEIIKKYNKLYNCKIHVCQNKNSLYSQKIKIWDKNFDFLRYR